MSAKVLQNMVCQIKDIIDYEFGIMDDSGLILACSNHSKAGTIVPYVSDIVQAKDNIVLIEGYYYQKVFIKNRLELIVFIKQVNEQSLKYLSLISINVNNIKVFYDEKYDKGHFIKNIIMDNVLPGEVPYRAKELHLTYNAYRVVYTINVPKLKDAVVFEILQGLFPNKAKDFIITIDESNTVLVKEVRSNDDFKEIEKTARIIVDTLGAELMATALVGIGTVAESLKDIARSFKESQMALLVGSIFESDRSVVNYNKLGIGRLIYQLPVTLCDLFLKEVFREGSFEALDQETMNTIQKFFEYSLNVSETSRQLYIHRNTLVYRLDKIEKITGLDLRVFDDAIIFKVAMLVKRYLDKADKII